MAIPFFASFRPRLVEKECTSLPADIQAALDTFSPTQSLAISLRNIPFGWDHHRNTTLRERQGDYRMR